MNLMQNAQRLENLNNGSIRSPEHHIVYETAHSITDYGHSLNWFIGALWKRTPRATGSGHTPSKRPHRQFLSLKKAEAWSLLMI